ncbi:MAG: nucleotidyltransferase domain-containing protein [Caldilineales bacterium]|nr:nucleotidyltransferase domain-containing protein [Caldilineales bacterium]
MLNNLTAEKLAIYRATAQARQRQKEAESQARRKRGWEVAHKAAQMLRDDFGATKVIVFGSLAEGRWFTENSDIDLAAWGIAADDYFTAVAKMQGIDYDFEIDLVAMEWCKSGLAKAIVEEGIAI